MSEATKEPATLIGELLRMVDEFLGHMAALEAENQNLREQLVSSGKEPEVVASDPVPVLVLDPEPARAAELVVMLGRCGCRGFAVGTSIEAMERAQSDDFSLVVVESDLGDEDGLDFVSRLRQAAPGLDCLIVVGFTSADIAVQALRLGASAFCIRPVQEEELRERVGELLQRQRIQRQSRRYLSDLRERYERILATSRKSDAP